MLPNFLIIGVEKGGTSWLWQNLRLHPDIFMPPVKEIHFFDKDENWQKGILWFKEFFSAAQGEKAIGEASPGYIIAPEAPKRIKATLPNVRLITTIRNPVDRAYSSYRMAVSKCHIEPASFEEAVQRYPHFLEAGLYGAQLKRYLDVFDREQIMVILFENLKRSPPEVLKSVLGFLQVDTDFCPPSVYEKHAPSRTVRYPALNRLTLAAAKTMRKSGLNVLVDLGKALRVKEFLFEWNTKKETYAPLSPKKRREYLTSFLEDMEIIEDLLQINLDHWRDHD